MKFLSIIQIKVSFIDQQKFFLDIIQTKMTLVITQLTIYTLNQIKEIPINSYKQKRYEIPKHYTNKGVIYRPTEILNI